MTTQFAPQREERGPTAPVEPVRVLVVEDHDLYRRSLVGALRSQPDIEVIGEAPDAWTLNEILTVAEPEVILLDMRLPGIDGLEILRKLHFEGPHPAPSVLVLSAFTDEQLVWRAIEAGAAGYLDKHASKEEIVAAVRSVARGGIAFTAHTARQVESGFAAAYGRSR